MVRHEVPPSPACEPATPTPRDNAPGSGAAAGLQAERGLWPRTGRLMPWTVAAFIAMIYLVPFDAIQLPVPLPVDPKLDRFFVIGALVVFLAIVFAGPRQLRLRSVPFGVLILLFVGIAIASALLNIAPLMNLSEGTLALKKVFLLVCNAIVFYIVASSVKPREVPRFALLIAGLATLTAIGTIIQYRSGVNWFYRLARDVLPGAVSVAPPPVHAAYDRPAVTGPTGHGLADVAILAVGFLFALVFAIGAGTARRKTIGFLAAGLILIGAFSTLRKTGIVAPAVGVLLVVLMRPRSLKYLAPLAVGFALATSVLAPGAIANLREQVTGHSSESAMSIDGRTSDYAAVWPDVLHHPLLGRGFGTYDPFKYRILDNQILLLLVEVGVVGLLAYLAVIFYATYVGCRAARCLTDARARSFALAVAAISVAFFIVQLLFDALSFPQVPYIFFIVLGLLAALVVGTGRIVSPTLSPEQERSA